jgi:hypothetical protein
MATSFGKSLSIVRVWLYISALAIFIGPANRAFAGTIYDAVSDFSITANPNGVWSYGWSATLGGPLNLYTNTDSTCYTGISAWSLYTCTTFLPAPQILHNNTDHVIHLAVFPQIAVPPTNLLLHPVAAGEYRVLQWTAPNAGIFKIRALYQGLDAAGPTTTDVHVLVQSAKTQITTSLLGGQIQSYELPMTATFPAVKLSAGDTVSFAVGFGADGNYNFDSTGLRAVIEGP